MPQIFQVLCCYKCEMFQVHQVKKSNKWQCRVCNEKQSLKKAFKIGSSRDCRSLVQELNMRKSGCVQEDEGLCSNSESLEDSQDVLNEGIHLTHNSPGEERFSTNEDDEVHSANEFNAAQHSRYLPHFDAERNEDSTAILKNVLTKPSNTLEGSKWGPASSGEIVKMVCPDVSKNPLKHPLEKDNDTACPKYEAPPPVKRSRGFQIILKAAAKLS